MKITFCLPSILKVPSGGFKIIFEYANRLTDRGYEVSIVCLTDTQFTKFNNPMKYFFGQFRIHGYPNWFDLDQSVKVIATPYLDGRHFPDADVVVATSARTSFIINDLPVSKGKKFYLIQDFETWGMSENKLIESYQLGLTNIVVSKWLSEIVLAKANVESKLLSNPIDTEKFFVVKPIEERSSFEIAMLYHTGKHKGIPIAFEALDRVKKEIPKKKREETEWSKPENISDLSFEDKLSQFMKDSSEKYDQLRSRDGKRGAGQRYRTKS